MEKKRSPVNPPEKPMHNHEYRNPLDGYCAAVGIHFAYPAGRLAAVRAPSQA